jgi:plasmid stability protein
MKSGFAMLSGTSEWMFNSRERYHCRVASITIRRLEGALKSRLRVRAARDGRSTEEEAREILRAGLVPERAVRLILTDSIGQRFAPLWRRGTCSCSSWSRPAGAEILQMIVVDTNVLSEVLKPSHYGHAS